MANHKQYVYKKGIDGAVDADFASAAVYEKVRAGEKFLFWRFGLKQYGMPLANVQRIYRRVEPVYGKLCCGGQSFVIEWLVLVLRDGSEVVVHIGDEVKAKAEALMVHLQNTHPEIQYGKVCT